jgi:hypothetical protein
MCVSEKTEEIAYTWNLTVLLRLVNQGPHYLYPSIMQGRVNLSLSIHASRSGQLLRSLPFGGGDPMHLFVLVENSQIFLHLRNLILEIKEDTVVQIFEPAV